MSGRGHPKIGNLAADPNKWKILFKDRFDLAGQFGDRVNMREDLRGFGHVYLPLSREGRREFFFHLLPRRHVNKG